MIARVLTIFERSDPTMSYAVRLAASNLEIACRRLDELFPGAKSACSCASWFTRSRKTCFSCEVSAVSSDKWQDFSHKSNQRYNPASHLNGNNKSRIVSYAHYAFKQDTDSRKLSVPDVPDPGTAVSVPPNFSARIIAGEFKEASMREWKPSHSENPATQLCAGQMGIKRDGLVPLLQMSNPRITMSDTNSSRTVIVGPAKSVAMFQVVTTSRHIVSADHNATMLAFDFVPSLGLTRTMNVRPTCIPRMYDPRDVDSLQPVQAMVPKTVLRPKQSVMKR
nr:hypothetical protein CFP56_32418 [Quercus suber]